jgi:hypothetical protein
MMSHYSELQTCAVSDVPGTENTTSESTATKIPVLRRGNRVNFSDKLSILRLSGIVLIQARILLLSQRQCSLLSLFGYFWTNFAY